MKNESVVEVAEEVEVVEVPERPVRRGTTGNKFILGIHQLGEEYQYCSGCGLEYPADELSSDYCIECEGSDVIMVAGSHGFNIESVQKGGEFFIE